MHEWITTVGVSLLTLLALAGSVMAVISLIGAAQPTRPATGTLADDPSQAGTPPVQPGATGRPMPTFAVSLAIGLGALVLYLHRWLWVRGDWQPLESHVDGLLMVTFLFMLAVIYLDRRARIAGIYAFALPVAALLLAWAICASSWTMELFAIGQFVKGLHIVCVYLGTLFLCLAAVAGGMYLFVQRLLRNKKNFRLLHRLASLEALETLIVRASGLGFAVLTLGLVTGLVVVTSGPGKLGPGWWYSSKVLLAVGAWAVYAVVINLRHSTLFRGSRAAWLAIFGVVLLFATFGAVTAMREPIDPAGTTNPVEPTEQNTTGRLRPQGQPTATYPLPLRGRAGERVFLDTPFNQGKAQVTLTPTLSLRERGSDWRVSFKPSKLIFVQTLTSTRRHDQEAT